MELIECVLLRRGRDSQGDLVEPGGLDLSFLCDDPIVLLADGNNRTTIGYIGAFGTTSEEITASVEFIDTPAGREIGRLYAEGFLRGWSIGFIPRRWQALACDAPLPPCPSSSTATTALRESTEHTRVSLWRKQWPNDDVDYSDTHCGWHILEADVMEVCALAIPCNPEIIR